MKVKEHLADLLAPEAYPEADGVSAVQLRETHISWLFFTERFVYKVKKPVDFGFVNYGTLAARRHCCHEELRLNRRHTAGVYLEVVEVVEGRSGIRFGGPGNVIDYAVKMKRLPSETSLVRRLESGALDDPALQRIGRFLAAFHIGADLDADFSKLAGSSVLRTHWIENDEQTEAFAANQVREGIRDRLRIYGETFFAANQTLLAQRDTSGFLRDGHGDLHAENIFMDESAIQLIDCVEFAPEYRIGDTVLDLAFLLMDLDARGYTHAADVIADEYFRQTRDNSGRRLLNFYKCYRAMIRGKIHAMKSGNSDDIQRYYALAGRYAGIPQPQLIVVCGLMGAGKSTLAKGLSESLPALWVRSDELRKERFGASGKADPWGEGIYSEELVQQVYKEMFSAADQALSEGRHVILDASFSQQQNRETAAALTCSHGAAFHLLEVACDEPTRRARLGRRAVAGMDASDGREAIMEQQAAGFEAFEAMEGHQVILGSEAPREVVRRAMQTIYRRYFEALKR